MKSIILKSSLAVALIAIPVTGIAIAKDKKNDRRDRMIERVDTNKDGKISVDEAVQGVAARFDKSDADANGELTLEEIKTAFKSRRAERRASRMLTRMDVNGDGKLTKAEMENRTRKRFAFMDVDESGFIEKDEMRRKGKNRGRKDRGQKKEG